MCHLATIGEKLTLGGQSLQEGGVVYLPAVCVSLLRDLTLRCHRVLSQAQAHSGVKGISPCLPQTALAGARAQPPVSAVHLSYTWPWTQEGPSPPATRKLPKEAHSVHLASNHWLCPPGATDRDKLVPTACVSRNGREVPTCSHVWGLGVLHCGLRAL